MGVNKGVAKTTVSDSINNPINKKNSISEKLGAKMLPTLGSNLPNLKKLGPDEEFIDKKECNVNWNYFHNGNDWNCKCSVGMLQSPINLCDKNVKEYKDEVYFHFTTKDEMDLIRPVQKIKNTGKTIKIDYNIGFLRLGASMTKYKGYQIHFHVPSEHSISYFYLFFVYEIFNLFITKLKKYFFFFYNEFIKLFYFFIDDKFYDMEMHLVYKIDESDKTGISQNANKIFIVSVLFEAIEVDENDNEAESRISSKFLNLYFKKKNYMLYLNIFCNIN